MKWYKIAFATMTIVALAGAAVTAPDTALLTERSVWSSQEVVAMIAVAGPWLVVVLMVVAVVASPIPSGPVALAAGALYGTYMGGFLIWAGAVFGATVAFGLSRQFGSRIFRRSSHPAAMWLIKPRSENVLMILIATSRLIPFISFDAVSYVAGLTDISALRFTMATAVGAAPISIGYAGIGAGLIESDRTWAYAAAACAVSLLLPVSVWLWHLVSRRICSEAR